MKSRFYAWIQVFSLIVVVSSVSAQTVIYDSQPSWISTESDFTTAVAFGDIDLDDDLDLVVGNYSYPYQFQPGSPGNLGLGDIGGELVVYENVDGVLAESKTEFILSGIAIEQICIESIALGDYDADGDLDCAVGLLVGNGNDGGARVFKNLNDPDFSVPLSETFYLNNQVLSLDPDEYYDCSCVRWVDYDCDGDLDLAAMEVPGILHLYNYDPEAATPFSPQTPIDFMPQSVYTGFSASGSGTDDPDITLIVNQAYGTKMEFGDIDQDGDLDLFMNTGTPVSIYENRGTDPFFDPAHCWRLEDRDREDVYCGSFGHYRYDNEEYLALAVGSRSFLQRAHEGSEFGTESWGNDLYILMDGSLEHIGQSVVSEESIAQSVTDIQWAYIEEPPYNGTMDLVAVSYPVFHVDDITGQGSWDRGYEQFHLEPEDISGPGLNFTTNIWTEDSENSDLSTSLALGDIDPDAGAITTDTTVINDTERRLIYADHFPMINARIELLDINGSAINPDSIPKVAYNLYDGWASIDSNYSGPGEWVSTALIYDYSSELDLAVGNDGENVVYYHGGSEPPGTPNITTPDLTGLPPYNELYQFHDPELANGTNLMAPDCIGASFIAIGGYSEGVESFLAKDDNQMKRIEFMANWDVVEIYKGHYYWGWVDKNLEYINNAEGVAHLRSWSSPLWSMGNYDFTKDDKKKRTSDERLHALYTRNLVNRYRPGGILSYVDAYNWGDWGVEVYQFVHEPWCPDPIFEYNHDETFEPLAYRMYLNYQMIKEIDNTLIVVSPDFQPNSCVDGVDFEEYLGPEMPYLNSLNNTDLPDELIPGSPDRVLWYYCDWINQQVHCGTVGSSITDFKDPFTSVTVEGSPNLRVGIEHYLWGFFEEGLATHYDIDEPYKVDWDPVLRDGDDYYKHPFLITDWHYWNYYGNIEDNIYPHSHWNAAHVAELFSIDILPNQEDEDYRLVNYCCHWLPSRTEYNTGPEASKYYEPFRVAAKLLNDNESTADTSDFYLEGITFPGPVNQTDVYCYTYHNANSEERVHFVKTEWDVEALGDCFVTDGWSFNLGNAAFGNGDKLDCYTPEGGQFQKEVTDGGTDNPDYIFFEPGEMGPGMLILHEPDQPISQQDYTQTLQLHTRWNLVSWHIEPPDPDWPIDPLQIQEVIPVGTNWFFNHGGELYRWLSTVEHYDEEDLWELGNQPWNLNNAYYIWLSDISAEDGSTWSFEDRPQYHGDEFVINPDPAWDDSLDELRLWPNQYTNGWYFIAYAAPGYCKLASVPVDPGIPPTNGDPDNYDYIGPFHWLFWEEDPPYNHRGSEDQYLVIVKTDDGRYYIPNDPNYQEGDDIDQIGVLEPGQGYFLGFRQSTTPMTFPGWTDYPGWPTEGLLPDPKSSPQQTASAGHFQFNKFTHWSYPVIIDTVDLEVTPMDAGDEIGVFDGDLCVGASVYGGEFPVVISCWKDDMATPEWTDGYTAGHEMTFVWYDVSQNQEVTFELPPMTQAVEDDPVAPTHSGFGAGIYARRSMVYGIKGVEQLPQEYRLGQNYPNPFNATTVIPLELPQRSHVRIELFNVRGQNLGMIYEGNQEAGWPKIRYKSSGLSSGVYLYRIVAEGLERDGTFQEVGKMLLLK